MPRYNRDDYSACDWRATKSDILRCRKSIAKKRRVRVLEVLGLLGLLFVIAATVDGILAMVR